MRRRAKLIQINYEIPMSKRSFSRLITMSKRTIPTARIEGFSMYIRVFSAHFSFVSEWKSHMVP